MAKSEKHLLLQTFHSSDEDDYVFFISLNRSDVDVLLRRIRLYHEYLSLEPHLDEAVFDGGLGGYFFRREAYSLFERIPPPELVADQVVVCETWVVPPLRSGRLTAPFRRPVWPESSSPTKENAWCGYCIAGALANATIFALTLLEAARAATGLLHRRNV